MVPLSKKRKLAAALGPAPKRSKGPRPTTPKGRKRTEAPTKRAVDAASLPWQSVGEDFGGLEVITGVDVVKHGDQVQFLVRERDDESHDNSDGIQCQDEDETFEGFGDDPVEGQRVDFGEVGSRQDGVASKKASQQVTSQDKPSTSKKEKKQKKKGSPATDLATDKALSKGGNSFGALATVAEGGQDIDLAEWVALNLSPRILSGIAKLGFAKPTAIQRMAIPEIVAGEDVIGKAQTGSGKTLAFGIPVVEKWLETREGEQAGPMALVLSPTRELAKQLGEHLKALCDGLTAGPYVCVVTGGLSIQKQQRQLAKADIIIGTPGRLWEVMDGDMALQESLTRIKFLIVDEADRLFKAGQFKEAEHIIGALDRRDPEADDGDGDADDELPPRQTLVFSATFDKDLQTKLAGRGRPGTAGTAQDKMAYLMKCLRFRREPKFLDANPVSQLADKLREGLIECGAMEKVSSLSVRVDTTAPRPC